MKVPVFIRKASIQDAKIIFNLVMELAIYEKSPLEVHTTELDFHKGLDEGLFYAILAEDEHQQVLGMALYQNYFSTWNGKALYLEDLIVREPYRRYGIGTLLFEAFLEESRLVGAKIVKWQVLDWNELAKGFYRKYNTKFYPGWENGVIYLHQKI
jgi:GNAT superfamily N-acetyltransferase